MLAARRLASTRVWSAATVLISRRHTLQQLPSFLKTSAFTVNMSSSTTWQKVGTLNDSYYSQSKCDATITAANPEPNRKMLKVRWDNGDEDLYPYIWLRDNCPCPDCFHPVSLSRRVKLKDLSLSVNCTDVKVRNGGCQVEVQWTDGHQGTYNAQWLQERAFRGPQNETPDRQCRLKQVYWGNELQHDIPRASFCELLRDDVALLSLLENLEIFGVVLVSDVPQELDQIKLLSKRVGHLKTTHYGETFHVHNKPDPNNLAYTGDTLDLHTDLVCLAAKPSIQLLHCIKQFTGEGGDTLLRDGFAAASKLRKNSPKDFDTLAQTMIEFMDIGIDDGARFHICSKAPIIELNADGSLKTINLHQFSRNSIFPVSSEEAVTWYAAILNFRDLVYDANSLVKLKLQSGDLMILDNLRVMHGRQGYRAELGERLLQGGYWEWDSVRSLRQVLRKEMVA